MTPEQKANRILLAAAHDAYLLPIRPPSTVRIDRRCPACGVARERCASPTCIRAAS